MMEDEDGLDHKHAIGDFNRILLQAQSVEAQQDSKMDDLPPYLKTLSQVNKDSRKVSKQSTSIHLCSSALCQLLV